MPAAYANDVSPLKTDGTIGSRIGSQTFFIEHQRSPEAAERVIDAGVKIGMKTLRYDIRFDHMVVPKEDGTTEYNQAVLNENLERLAILDKKGVMPILVFSTVHPFLNNADSAFGDNLVGWPMDRGTRRVYADFVADTIKTFQEKFSNMKFVAQIGNEVPSNSAWKDPARRVAYIETLIAVGEALEAKGVKVHVIASSHSVGALELEPMKQLIELATQTGAIKYIDGVSISLYNHENDKWTYPANQNKWGAPEACLKIMKDIRDLIGPDKSFYVTEAGSSSGELREEGQALVNLRSIFVSLMSGANGTTIYELTDRLQFRNYSPIDGTMGIFTWRGEKKLAAEKIADFIKKYGDFKYESHEQFDENHFQMTLTKGKDKVHIRWSTDPKATTKEFPWEIGYFKNRLEPKQKFLGNITIRGQNTQIFMNNRPSGLVCAA